MYDSIYYNRHSPPDSNYYYDRYWWDLSVPKDEAKSANIYYDRLYVSSSKETTIY